MSFENSLAYAVRLSCDFHIYSAVEPKMYRVDNSNDLSSVLALIGITLFASLSESTCYYPSGVIAGNPIYLPCVMFGETTSMCCATNRTNPAGGDSANGITADQCLPNGLCQNVLKYRNTEGAWSTNVTYWRNQCTSMVWTDDGCLNICTDITVCARHYPFASRAYRSPSLHTNSQLTEKLRHLALDRTIQSA